MPWLRMSSRFGIQDIGFGLFAALEAIRNQLIALATIIIDHRPAPRALASDAKAFVASFGTAFALDYSPTHRHRLRLAMKPHSAPTSTPSASSTAPTTRTNRSASVIARGP